MAKILDSQELFLLYQIKEQNEKLLKQNEELLKVNRLFLPICELSISQEEKEYLVSRGARTLGDLLKPEFFDAAEAKFHQGIIKFLKDWGYSPRIPDDMTIEEMDFSARTRNALGRSKILFLSDILAISEKDALKIRNLGRHSIVEIRNKLLLLGYDW